MAEIVCCQSFGQTTRPSLQSFKQGQTSVDRKWTTDRLEKLPVLISFTNTPLEPKRAPDIKFEKREGPGSGGGGNSCALMIKENTRDLLKKLSEYAPLRSEEVYFKKLLSSIRQAKFLLGENLYIEGKKVQAINYPDLNTIVVEPSFCEQMETISLKSMGILLHEYLGLARIDDTEFQISGDLIQKLNTVGNNTKNGQNLKLDKSASVDQCPSIDGKFVVTSEINQIGKKDNSPFSSLFLTILHFFYDSYEADKSTYSISLNKNKLIINQRQFALTNKEVFLEFSPKDDNYFVKYRAGCSKGNLIIEFEGANNTQVRVNANGTPVVKRYNTYIDRSFIFYKNESTLSIVIDSEVYGLDGSLLAKGQKTLDLEKQ